MLELIFSAIGLGIMLSVVFIGPIFFLLIETSFSRGARHALALDFGVIFADVICIIAAYYASSDIVEIIDQYPGFYRITALIVFIYGIFMMVTKTKMHLPKEAKIISQNYFTTFLNGFLFNMLNIGVILFWLVTVISIRNQYEHTYQVLIYLFVVILTYLAIDLLKIILAKQFHHKLTQNIANLIRKSVGVVLIIFSIFIFLQSFKQFNHFNKQLEEAEKTQISTKKIQ